MIEDGDTLRLQPCKSPVWDTAITLRALAAAGLNRDHASARRAVDWLLDQEIDRRGDWCKTVAAEPAGWCFEYANEFYPDVDDTTMVVMALASQVESAGRTTDPAGPSVQLVEHRSCRQRQRSAGARGRARPPGRRPPSRAVDWVLRDAKSRRRLGSVRPRQRSRVSLPRAVCRSQRDDRSQHARLDGPRARDVRPPWAAASATRRSIGPWTTFAARRKPTGAGSAAGASTTSMAPGSRWSGCRPSVCRANDPDDRRRRQLAAGINNPPAAGANRPTATPAPSCAGRERRRPRKRPGPCWV